MSAHTYRCPSELATGPCPNAVPCECVGPFSQDGGRFSCAGNEPCEPCRLAIDRGFRCDSCGLVDDSVKRDDWTGDAYCEGCRALVEDVNVGGAGGER